MQIIVTLEMLDRIPVGALAALLLVAAPPCWSVVVMLLP